MSTNQEKLNRDLIDNARKGNLENVKSLIENGANVDAKSNYGDTALTCSSSNGRFEIVKHLIENGANVNPKGIYRNETALINAVKCEDFNIVKYLVDNGADVNAKEYEGQTALMFASFNGDLEITKYLLDNGADVNVESDVHEYTALDWAKENRKLKIVKCLREFINKENVEENTEDSLFVILNKCNDLGISYKVNSDKTVTLKF